jgi:hypothetical protein
MFLTSDLGETIIRQKIFFPITDKYIHTYIIQHVPHQGFSVTDYIKYYIYLYYVLSRTIYLCKKCDISFPCLS